MIYEQPSMVHEINGFDEPLNHQFHESLFLHLTETNF